MNEKQANIVAQLFNVLAVNSPNPADTYDYLTHTIFADGDSLSAIVGTICGLADDFRRKE